jgi:tetratricopeptide (TPR) repeat protein
MPKAAPHPPKNVQVIPCEHGLSVTWDPVPKATHYTVFWGTDPARFRHLSNTRTCSVRIPGLRRGRKYSVAVTAWNQRGESDFSRKKRVVFDYDPSMWPHYVSLGVKAMERGRFEDAEAYFNAAVQLVPDNPQVYLSRSRFYKKIARSDLARRDARSAEEIRKKKPPAKTTSLPWGMAAGS